MQVIISLSLMGLWPNSFEGKGEGGFVSERATSSAFPGEGAEPAAAALPEGGMGMSIKWGADGAPQSTAGNVGFLKSRGRKPKAGFLDS